MLGGLYVKLLSPAEYVIYAFGGVHAAARAIGRDAGSVCAWKRPRSRKGSDGRVPGKAQMAILRVARDMQIDITPEDLVIGRMVDDV